MLQGVVFLVIVLSGQSRYGESSFGQSRYGESSFDQSRYGESGSGQSKCKNVAIDIVSVKRATVSIAR